LCGRVTSLSGDAEGGLTITYWAHDTALKAKIINKDTTADAQKMRIIARDTAYKYYGDTIKQAVLTEKELEDNYRVNVSSDVDFFRDNPVFIIWAVFIIAMFVMWFASFFPLLYLNKEISLYPKFTELKLWEKGLKYFMFSIVVLLVFHYIIFVSFFDSTPYFSSLFIPGWKWRFLTMNIIGFIACGPIFTGMMNVYRAAAELEPTDTDAITYLEGKLKIFLLAISIGFSFVLTTTSLLNIATNELQFVQKITKDLGHTPMHTEFVLAYGVVYSLLIAIFYLPSALRLYHLKLMQPAVAGVQNTGGRFGMKGPITNVINELVKSSAPLVTSIITSILAMIFQGQG